MTEITMTENPGLDERIGVLLDDVLRGGSVFPINIVVRGRSGSRVVEVFVDSDEQLVVEELARINRELGHLLEEREIISGAYRLNVSTPGVGSPLKLARQYPRNVGRRMHLLLAADEAEDVEVEAVLESASADRLVFRLDDGTELPVDFPSIKEAKVLLPW